MTLADRFWAKVDVNGPTMAHMTTPCHLWLGNRDTHGYGGIWAGAPWNRQERAHRVAFFLLHGRWPKPMGCHRCDNPTCCRADHIFEGTQADNMRDSSAKGRHARYCSTKTHCPKGHPYDAQNTRYSRNQRVCRACANASLRRWKARRKAA